MTNKAILNKSTIPFNINSIYTVLIVALAIRLLAAIFSQGFAMYDDHFVIMETPQKWLWGDKATLNPDEPLLHSIVYPGMHYALFAFLESFGMVDPVEKAMVVRILHALWSLLVVWLVWLITKQLSDKKTAIFSAWFTALFWLFPFVSVRCLAEWVSVVPLLLSLYLSF
jgi:hypothetical protein